jgi:hypothetical protein
MRALALMFAVTLGACARPALTGVRQLEVSGPVELHVTFTAGAPLVLPDGLEADLEGHLRVDASSARLIELTLPGSVELVARAGAHVTVKGDALPSLTLRAPGGAIDGHVDVDSLHVDGTAGGSVSLDGRTRVLELGGEGLSFDGAQLTSEVARVDLGGEGRARVLVRQQATGAVRGGVLQVVGPGRVEVVSRGGSVERGAPETVSLGRR